MWLLSEGLKHPRRTSTESHPLVDGEVPLVGNQATAPGHCPTATKSGERYGEIAANKVNAPRTPPGTTAIPGNRGDPRHGSGQPALRRDQRPHQAAEDARRPSVLRPVEHPQVDRGVGPPLGQLGPRRRHHADDHRLAATTNGISRDQLLDYARWHIRSLACQHGALSPGGWGNNWQSALWAVTAGQAGWLLWDELNYQERAYVGAMVISEADYASARGPRYFRNRLGPGADSR